MELILPGKTTILSMYSLKHQVIPGYSLKIPIRLKIKSNKNEYE